MFTEEEVEYLSMQVTRRLATVTLSMQPDVAPVGYLFDGVTFTIRGDKSDEDLEVSEHEGR